VAIVVGSLAAAGGILAGLAVAVPAVGCFVVVPADSPPVELVRYLGGCLAFASRSLQFQSCIDLRRFGLAIFG